MHLLTQVLGTESKSSEKAASALNSWTSFQPDIVPFALVNAPATGVRLQLSGSESCFPDCCDWVYSHVPVDHLLLLIGEKSTWGICSLLAKVVIAVKIFFSPPGHRSSLNISTVKASSDTWFAFFLLIHRLCFHFSGCFFYGPNAFELV